MRPPRRQRCAFESETGGFKKRIIYYVVFKKDAVKAPVAASASIDVTALVNEILGERPANPAGSHLF